jgi:Protein of unknown function (DUF1566)
MMSHPFDLPSAHQPRRLVPSHLKWSVGPFAVALLLFAPLGNADTPVGRYTVATDTVTDTKTGLVWERVEDPSGYTWVAAKTQCANLNTMAFGGFSSGWRLPTVKELQTLVDDSLTISPSIDPVFTGANAYYYWSTTPLANSGTNAWTLGLNGGGTASADITTSKHVRCVR